MKVGLRGAGWVLCVLLMILMGICTAYAEETAEAAEAVTTPAAYRDVEGCIPPELSALLPEGLFAEDAQTVLNAAEELTDWAYLLRAVLGAVGLRLDSAVGLLCTLLGLILLAAVMGRLREGLGGTCGEAFGFCLRLVIYTAIVLRAVGILETVQTYFDQLNTLTMGMIPAMGGLYALGGNVGQAAVNGEVMLVFSFAMFSVSLVSVDLSNLISTSFI